MDSSCSTKQCTMFVNWFVKGEVAFKVLKFMQFCFNSWFSETSLQIVLFLPQNSRSTNAHSTKKLYAPFDSLWKSS